MKAHMGLVSVTRPGRKSELFKPMLIIFLCLLSSLVIYIAFGHQLLQRIYDGRAIGFLNGVIVGQSQHPLDHYLEIVDSEVLRFAFSIPLLLVIISVVLRPKLVVRWPLGRKSFEHHTDTIDAIPDSHVGPYILLASALGLYLELTVIRVHSSYFQLFAYFKNVSLFSCFLGLGIGYAIGVTRPLTTPLVIPFLAAQVAFMHVYRFSLLSELLQNPISEHPTMGLGTGSIGHVLIAYGFLALIFSFNALCFVPLGHLTSRLMMRTEKLISYGWNLIGSIVGVLLFSLVAFMWTPPTVWIIIAAVGLMVFLRKDMLALLPSLVAVTFLVVLLAKPSRLNEFDVYSPYQILTLHMTQDNSVSINTSNVYYQKMLDLSRGHVSDDEEMKKAAIHYELPYQFKPRPERVLIVGSGAGNDVAAAIRNGAKEIDAVEIDPAILEFGSELHPEAPYHAMNVNAINDDARAFISQTKKRYDLIVYGLLDSHTLLAGMSGGIRLDSYVYTVEGLRESRDKLRDGGVISLSFSLIRPELGRKLFLMLQAAFDGQTPIVYQVGYDGGFTFLSGDKMEKPVIALPPPIKDVTGKFADAELRVDESTDDWPFFYMPVRKYPISYAVIILILAATSWIFIRQLIPGGGMSFSVPCFCLGIGFMLIEAKAITELALVYGSTWVVISAVIMAILIMAFFANFLVMKLGNLPRRMTYGLLCISVLVGLSATFFRMESLAPWMGRMIMTGLLTLPLFFSGFAFSAELRASVSVAVALSSNLLGAMVGGFLEYNSMYMGFRSLYLIAMLAYAFAFIGSKRGTA